MDSSRRVSGSYLLLKELTCPLASSKTRMVFTVFWWVDFSLVSTAVWPLRSICRNMFSADSSRAPAAPAPLCFSREPASCHPLSSPRKRKGSQSYFIWLAFNCIPGGIDATYVSSSDNLILAIPDQTVEGQQTRRNVKHRAGRLLRCARVHDSDAAVVSGESESITARGEGDTLDPASSVVQVFTTDGVEGQTLAPSARLRALINTLDEAGEDARVGVGGTGCEKH